MEETKDKNKMATTFAISNSDVITMLVVKHREKLNAELAVIILEYTKLLDVQINTVLMEYEKAKQSVDWAIATAYEKLLKLLNPTSTYKVVYGSDTEDNIKRRVMDLYQDYGYREVKRDSLFLDYSVIDSQVRFKDDNCPDDFTHVCSGVEQFGVNIPIKFRLKVDTNPEIVKLSNRMAEIRILLNNEAKLKEQLIAKVTENAIKDMPEFKVLLDGIDNLALNS